MTVKGCFFHRVVDCPSVSCQLHEILDSITALAITTQTIAEQLNRIEQKQQANQKEITMLIQEALDAINEETNTIADEQVKLGDRVAALIAQLGTLTPAQEAEVAAIKAHQATLVTALHGMAADPENPVPTPVPPAPPTVPTP